MIGFGACAIIQLSRFELHRKVHSERRFGQEVCIPLHFPHFFVLHPSPMLDIRFIRSAEGATSPSEERIQGNSQSGRLCRETSFRSERSRIFLARTERSIITFSQISLGCSSRKIVSLSHATPSLDRSSRIYGVLYAVIIEH